MGAKLEREPKFEYNGRPVSALGLKLRELRKQIEAAAGRGETKLLNKDELAVELENLRDRDSDLR